MLKRVNGLLVAFMMTLGVNAFAQGYSESYCMGDGTEFSCTDPDSHNQMVMDCYNAAVGKCATHGGLASYTCQECQNYPAPTLNANGSEKLVDSACPPAGSMGGWYMEGNTFCNNP